jgi:predicted O-linked N-acetylglucosamine transferase (SPINDLY family)
MSNDSTAAGSAGYWLQVGQQLRAEKRWVEASEALARAAALDPQNAGIWRVIGLTEVNAGRYPQAEAAYQRSLAVAPGNVETTICYAFLLNQQSQPQRALELLRDVVSHHSELAIAWLVLGHSCELIGDMEAAEAATRNAVTCSPHDPAARYQLANVLFFRWKLIEAEVQARELLMMQPNHADGWALLGLILRAFARHDESLAALRQAVTIGPTPANHSKLLAGLQYAEGVTAEMLREAHLEWDRMHGGASEQSAASAAPHAPPGTLGRRVRVGLLSSDLAQHPTGFMVLPAIEHLDKEQCEIVCYSDRAAHDDYTDRFRAAASEWRTTQGMPGPALLETMRADKLDILLDLNGHFGERMPLFFSKPAPVQITWFGYVGTTGLSAMDALLADPYHVRAGEELYYAETVLRMPADYACFGPPTDAPDVGRLPAALSGQVTFGCFNNPAKFTPQMVDAWCEILRRVPEARMLFKFGWIGDPGAKARLLIEFSRRGIDDQRIMIEGHSPQREVLETYNRVDLALDTQPYSGGLTTCEALWMGVPVITYPGRTFAGRHSTSHLTNAGYSQFVAADVAGYVELAVEWANRHGELAAVRREMRDQVRRSPLCDAPRFAADLLSLLSTAQPRAKQM